MQADQVNNIISSIGGAPVDNIRHGLTVGPRGPTLLQDAVLLENIQIHNRERIPERNVHARGCTAKGEFVVTEDLSDLTVADFVQKKGQKTPVAIRFSTVIHGIHSPEFLRDPRGFAVKLYTQQGNYDIVGNNWPVFFTRDGIQFPEMVRALKPNPATNVQEWWRIWDYFAGHPEALHAFTWLLDDIGIPKGFRFMHGWSINTYKLLNKDGKETLFRWYFESKQGEIGQLEKDACRQNFGGHSADLMDSIKKGDFPKFDVKVQTIDPSSLPDDFDPLDATKEWPPARFPYRKVGEITLNENVKSIFMENEMIAFSPARVVPGIAPSDDKLLQARLFAYADTQTYRLGINNQLLPINAPKCPFFSNQVDGAMQFNPYTRGGQEINYYPSVLNKTHKEGGPFPQDPEQVSGKKERRDPAPQFDDAVQAGNRWRSFDKERQTRFADRVSLTLQGENINDELLNIWLNLWDKVDPELGKKIRLGAEIMRSKSKEFTGEKKEVYDRLQALSEDFFLTTARP